MQVFDRSFTRRRKLLIGVLIFALENNRQKHKTKELDAWKQNHVVKVRCGIFGLKVTKV